jgi:hypothetical protein
MWIKRSKTPARSATPRRDESGEQAADLFLAA